MIPVDEVVPNPNQPRVHFDEAALADLADSIAQIGVLQPVLVRRVDDGFQLIAGERTVAGGAPRRPHRDPGDRARLRRRGRRGGGARREPPSRRSHRPRGGRRLPAADRGLPPHPRRRGQASGQESLGGHQHAASDGVAAGSAAAVGRRQALRRTRASPARDRRPRPPGAARRQGGRRGLVGACRGGRRPPRRAERAGAGPDRRATSPSRPTARDWPLGRACARPACSNWRNCSPITSTRGSTCRWGPSVAG